MGDWLQVPNGVLRSALSALSESSAALSRRLRQLESEFEAERLRSTDTRARLVSRVDELERQLSRRDRVDDTCRDLEARLRLEVDAARADAAASRAAATWRGASDELMAASAASAVDRAVPCVLSCV